MSKITNYDLTRSVVGCIMAVATVGVKGFKLWMYGRHLHASITSSTCIYAVCQAGATA